MRKRRFDQELKGNLSRLIDPALKDTIEDTESSTKASDLGIVHVVVVIGVAVGISEEGNSKKLRFGPSLLLLLLCPRATDAA